jgi:hypothetical protein
MDPGVANQGNKLFHFAVQRSIPDMQLVGDYTIFPCLCANALSVLFLIKTF